MFWYLGVINKSQAAAPIKNNNINTSHQPVSSSSSSSSSSSPSPSGSSKRQQGNARTGKAKNNHSNVPSSHHTQQNQRNPGVKKWGNNKGGDEEKANGKSKATVGRKGPKKVRSGWTDGDSSSSDSSDEDDRPRHSGRRQADQDSSDSDSDSADHLQSSSDDDEKPLGTRIRSKHITMPNSSPQSTAPLLPSSSSDLIRWMENTTESFFLSHIIDFILQIHLISFSFFCLYFLSCFVFTFTLIFFTLVIFTYHQFSMINFLFFVFFSSVWCKCFYCWQCRISISCSLASVHSLIFVFCLHPSFLVFPVPPSPFFLLFRYKRIFFR